MEAIDITAIGLRLKELREKAGYTQEEVANVIGISRSAIQMYENGERMPRDEIKMAIAKFYNKSVQSIFFA